MPTHLVSYKWRSLWLERSLIEIANLMHSLFLNHLPHTVRIRRGGRKQRYITRLDGVTPCCQLIGLKWKLPVAPHAIFATRDAVILHTGRGSDDNDKDQKDKLLDSNKAVDPGLCIRSCY